MQQATTQSADVLPSPPALPAPPSLPAPAHLQGQPTQPAPPAQPAIPAIPAIPAVPAIPAIPAAPAIGPATAFPSEPISFSTAPAVWSTEQSFRDLIFSDGFQIASFLLVFPFAIALARRVWVRGAPRTTAMDLENSPRLQRIEQAIESIALEVERIGEAQRFTTKLLAEREPVAGRLPAASAGRRDPGVITPH